MMQQKTGFGLRTGEDEKLKDFTEVPSNLQKKLKKTTANKTQSYYRPQNQY